MHRTPGQIRTIGLEVLKRELGVAGMIQFLEQFDAGAGDWARERREWVDRISLADIRKATAKWRRRPKPERARTSRAR